MRLRGLSTVTQSEYLRCAAHFVAHFRAPPERLGAELAFTLVLHTWTRELLFHPHIHAIVTGGGLSVDGGRRVGVKNADFLFPKLPVAEVFRGKFLSGFIALQKAGKIDLTEQQSRKLSAQGQRTGLGGWGGPPSFGPISGVPKVEPAGLASPLDKKSRSTVSSPIFLSSSASRSALMPPSTCVSNACAACSTSCCFHL